MLATLVFGLLTTVQDTNSTSAIKTASLFKNGYAMIVREYAVNEGGETIITPIPQATMGTFWVATSQGVKIVELVSTLRPKTIERAPANLSDMLSAAVGKEVAITTVNLGTLSGKLLSADGDLVMVRVGQETSTFTKGEVRKVTLSDGSEPKLKVQIEERVLRVRTQGKGIMIAYGLEYGITWAPAYAIDISDPKNLTLSAKSTVLNDLADLNNADLRFVTGFPNVPWATLTEPLLSGQGVSQFVNFLQSIGIPEGGFRGRADMSGNVASQRADQGFADSFGLGTEPGVQSEDLFFYKQPKVTLKRGDRAFYMLFEAKAPYEHVYTVDLPPGSSAGESRGPGLPASPIDVWHALKFKNTSKQPLTTAPATVFKDGQVMGQDTIKYTSVDSEILLNMSKALDIRVEADEEEVARERAALKGAYGNTFDLVTVQGKVSIKNPKSEAIMLRISKNFEGELISAEGSPKSTKSAIGLRDVNPRSSLLWTPKLDAGGTLNLIYKYKVYVQAR